MEPVLSSALLFEKPSHQLLYLIYGNQDIYRREANFSVLTALSHIKQGELLCLRVLTDCP